MSEHPSIDLESYQELLIASALSSADGLDANDQYNIEEHVLYAPGHIEHYGMVDLRTEKLDPQLMERFEAEVFAHKAAILRGEISVVDLLPSYRY